MRMIRAGCAAFLAMSWCDASDDFMEVSIWPKLPGRPGSPGSRGGSHGGGPEPPGLMWELFLTGLAHYMTTPEQRAEEIRRRLREGNIAHECEALAQFADITWEDMQIHRGRPIRGSRFRRSHANNRCATDGE